MGSEVKALLFASTLACSMGAEATCQSKDILGRDNTDFARELYRKGYIDLAEGVCKTLEKAGGASTKEAVEIQGLYLDLRLETARREIDPIKKKDLIADVLQKKEDFIQKNPGAKEAEEARNSLPELCRVLGEALTVALQKETDTGVIAKLRGEGEAVYKRAEDALKARIESLKDKREDPAAELQYMAATYNLPRTRFFHSLLYQPGTFEKKSLLELALGGFQEFELDYEDQLLCYEGYVYQGLCQRDLGKVDDALDAFESAIKLREAYADNKDAKGKIEVPIEAVDVISHGVLQKLLLQKTEKKDPTAAIATAKDFLNTFPNALQASQGFAILAALAETQIETGDTKSGQESAQKLADADPLGKWGPKGREIMAKLITGGPAGGAEFGAEKILRIAETLALKGDYDKALRLCWDAIGAAHGGEKEAEHSTDGYLIIGAIYAKRQWIHEASVAFDVPANKYPNATRAGDALHRSLLCYLELQSKEKRPYYKKEITRRSTLLATQYPKHPEAARIQLLDGQELEGEKKYVEAASFYEKVPPTSPSYLDAQYRAGNCYIRYGRQLVDEKKPKEAGEAFKKGEGLLKKARDDAEKAAKDTLDEDLRKRLDSTAFGARTGLAHYYLMQSVNREAEVLPLLEGLDEKFAAEPDKVSAVWTFRVQALQAQGKLDEAVNLLEALLQKKADANRISVASSLVARALDERATEQRKRDPKSTEPDALWRKAARLYGIGMGPQVRGEVSVRVGEAIGVGDRLYVMALHFNGVPEKAESFVDFPEPLKKDAELMEHAIELYKAALTAEPSYKTSVNLGRALGYLGKWKEATEVYAKLFEQDVVFERSTKKVNRELLGAKPTLLPAYLEWGIAELHAARADKEPVATKHAYDTLDILVKNTDSTMKLWWLAKLHQVQSLMEAGDYVNANLIVRDIERGTTDWDGGKFGAKEKFVAIKAELATKVPSKQEPTPAKTEKK